MTRISIKTLAASSIALLALCGPASAQQGFPDILEDIFKTEQQDRPFGGTGINQVFIENIPLIVAFDSRADLLPPEAMLIVTAIAPPPPNVRRASPLVIGETRLLISRLALPLNMVVAVPSDMARELDYAQIEARIIDANGNTTHSLRDSLQYSGGEALYLDLKADGIISQDQGSDNTTTPYTGTIPTLPAPYLPINGTVRLNDEHPIMRGSKLYIQVYENELAGGMASSTIAQEIIDIDNQQSPFTFDAIVPLGDDNRLDAPEIEAWIEDWAGRKTHIMSAPISFAPAQSNGPTSVSLRLDSMVTGADAVPPNVTYTPPANLLRKIDGEAKVNAYKGLPAGSTLIVSLQDGADLSGIIDETRIPLDGMSGDIPFSMSVNGSKLDYLRADPLLNARIDDRSGKTLLRSRTLVTLGETNAQLDLQPTEIY